MSQIIRETFLNKLTQSVQEEKRTRGPCGWSGVRMCCIDSPAVVHFLKVAGRTLKIKANWKEENDYYQYNICSRAILDFSPGCRNQRKVGDGAQVTDPVASVLNERGHFWHCTSILCEIRLATQSRPQCMAKIRAAQISQFSIYYLFSNLLWLIFRN